MLRLNEITVAYGRVVAIRHLSLAVEAGEIVALIGHNGAGKTTTMNAITGINPPVSGEAIFDGQSLAKTAPEKIARSGLALVPEGRRIFGRLSVGENLLIGTSGRRDRRAVRGEIEGMLDRFPVLRSHFSTSAAKLSGGEQQQLAIARALLARPKLLLLDEPSLGLAPMIVDQVFAILVQLRDEGVSILCAEQEVSKLLQVADRSYVLRAGGQVEFEGSAEELRSMADFDDRYLGFHPRDRLESGEATQQLTASHD